MPAEHRRPNGLSHGYFCHNCGMPCNMYGSGHSSNHGQVCEANPKLVAELIKLNSREEDGKVE